MIAKARKRSRSLSDGRVKGRASLPEEPGVLATLAFVLGLPEDADHRVTRLARVRRVVVRRGTRWSTNRAKLAFLFRNRRLGNRVPRAMAVYGLGGMLAWGNGEQIPRFRALEKLPTRQFKALLHELVRIARSRLATKAYDDVTYKRFTEAKEIDHALLQGAHSSLRYPPRCGTGFFGFGHAFLTLLGHRPGVIGRWLQQSLLPPEIHSVIVGAVANEVQEHRLTDNRKFAASLVRTRLPFFRALAACALAGEAYSDDGMEFADLFAELMGHDVAPTLAFRLALVTVENARVTRYGTRSKFEGDLLQAEAYVRNPDAAPGGRRNAEPLLERLREGLPGRRAAKDAAELVFERLVSSVAKAFAAYPELRQELEGLQRALGPYAAEALLKVGEALGDHPGADAVLDAVIDLGAHELGLKEPVTFDADSKLSTDTFESVRTPLATAICVRYRSDPKGPGRRAGQLLQPLAKAGDWLLGAPYAAHRWPLRYEQALQRRMSSVILAIEIARLGNAQERQAKAHLLKLALGHAENLLRCEREDVDSGGFGLMLALSAVEAMSSEPCEDLRPRWIADQSMDALGRAAAIWSKPAFALADEAQARQMFLLATQASLHGPHPSRLTRALNLLDMAFATMLQANSAQGFALLGSTWQAALANGRIPGAKEYVEAFDVLTRAAGSPDDAPLSNNMTWRTSRTAFALTAAKSQLASPTTPALSAGASREAPPTNTDPRGSY